MNSSKSIDRPYRNAGTISGIRNVSAPEALLLRPVNSTADAGSPRVALGSWRRASACRPGPEFLGVEYRPDVPDPVACDIESQDRQGDSGLLRHQAWLTVDCTFPDRQV